MQFFKIMKLLITVKVVFFANTKCNKFLQGIEDLRISGFHYSSTRWISGHQCLNYQEIIQNLQNCLCFNVFLQHEFSPSYLIEHLHTKVAS